MNRTPNLLILQDLLDCIPLILSINIVPCFGFMGRSACRDRFRRFILLNASSGCNREAYQATFWSLTVNFDVPTNIGK